MTQEKRRKILTSVTLITAAAVIILTVVGIVAENNSYRPASWVLMAYGDNVALYNDGKVITVYGEISLDALPEEDARLLENGIAFPTRAEAVRAVEDYE